jgi:hypothetical protein
MDFFTVRLKNCPDSLGITEVNEGRKPGYPSGETIPVMPRTVILEASWPESYQKSLQERWDLGAGR